MTADHARCRRWIDRANRNIIPKGRELVTMPSPTGDGYGFILDDKGECICVVSAKAEEMVAIQRQVSRLRADAARLRFRANTDSEDKGAIP